MVPAGGVHMIRPSIALAAEFAGIDYAEAVTGFDFVRNKASARIKGIVVAKENVEGLLAVWEGMMERVKDEEERLRRRSVLERWQRFFIKLGIKMRLDERHGKIDDEDEEEYGNMDDDEGGGFLPEDVGTPAVERENRASDRDISYSHPAATMQEASNIGLDSNESRRRDLATESLTEVNSSAALVHKSDNAKGYPESAMALDNDGGGFIIGDQDNDEGGGFLPAEEEQEVDDDFEYEEDDGIL